MGTTSTPYKPESDLQDSLVCVEIDGVKRNATLHIDSKSNDTVFLTDDGNGGIEQVVPDTWSFGVCPSDTDCVSACTLWEISGETNGVNGQRWAANAADHAPTCEIFSPYNQHVNGDPDEQIVSPNWNLADVDFPDTVDVTEGASQELYYAWVYLDKPAILNDNNGNTGEFIKAFVGGCGQEPQPIAEAGPTTGAANGLGDFANLGAGLYQIAVQVSDRSVYGGFNLRWSTDGGETFTAFPVSQTWTSQPEIKCRKVHFCEDGILDAVTGELVQIDPAIHSWCEISCPEIKEEPLPDIEFSAVTGCDDVNDGDNANWVTVTREIVFSNGEKVTTFYTGYGTDAEAEYTLIGAFVDCATGEPLEEPPEPPPECIAVTMATAYAPNGRQGVNVERWVGNAVTGLSSTAAPNDAFSNDPDYSGMPGHVNGAPDSSVLEADLFINDGNNGQDQMRYWAYLYTTEAIRVRDRVAFADATDYYLGECCGPVVLDQSNAYPNTDVNQQYEISLPAGIHYIGGAIYDFSAWGGVRYQYSSDGGVTWSSIPQSWLYAEKPTLAQCPVKVCHQENGTTICTDLKTGVALSSEFTLKRPDLCSSSPNLLPECTFISLGSLYRLGNYTPGSLVEYWAPTASPLGGNAAPHGNVDEIFTIQGNKLTHVNGAPSHSFVGSYFGYSTPETEFVNGVGGTRDDTNGTDQVKASAYLVLDSAISLTDVNGNTGERGVIALDLCCGGDLQIKAVDNTDSVGGDTTAAPPVTIPAGIHYVEGATSDLSAWQGLDLRDGDGNRVISSATKPTYTAIPVLKCVETGELFNAITNDVIEVEETDRWEKLECQCPCSSGSGDSVSAQTLRIV